ncbi:MULTISPECIES: hypothetical protein [Brevibacillus]|uniref:hypothetical protein n=1 Tax=Brevibacillus TaxID=55080 RepID=UPI000D107986|nr:MULTISPECIES: hypothetical protein [Brevibacillus]PSJ67508.1 hypothetical protein C7J99_19650 [Brevibacillus brevis]RED32817.1 hypothetical protein DES34_103129 [Brevibacillus brevis]TQK73740.1 hypothetical protein FB479_102374 [Brevibacillus sp. AG162]VEF90490.1 Uncharacterised protein [Brevibacillus brevis]GEC92840.1 hypothetical protein BBR01nite_51710 [Brevibacillus brevis]
MNKIQQIALVIGLIMYLLTPVFSYMKDVSSMTAYERIKPQESQSNAQEFLTHILENIHEGNLGGDITFHLTKEELQSKFGIKDEDYVSVRLHTSYFDRNGYRYILNKYKGKERLTVIQAKFESLTKEQIFNIFGENTYGNHKYRYEIWYKVGDFMVMFSNTDPDNRNDYNSIMVSPRTTFKN